MSNRGPITSTSAHGTRQLSGENAYGTTKGLSKLTSGGFEFKVMTIKFALLTLKVLNF